MRRRNHRTKATETLKKNDPQFGFTNPDPSSSSDSKRRRSVTFVNVDHRSPLNDSPEAQTGRSLDAKTSEFAFFKKLKSDFGICSESSGSKPSNKVSQIPKTFESRSKRGEYAGTDHEAKDRCNSYSFSTPIHKARRGSCGLSMSPVNLTRKDKEKDPGKSSSGFSRDKDTVRGGNNLRCGGSSDEKGDLFSSKRKRLNQWVKDTWSTELTSNGHDLVSVLLTRLFPGTEETHPSRFSKERTDRVKRRRTFLDSPGSKFLKKSHESCTEFDHSLKMERARSISWHGLLENSIPPSLQFEIDHVHSSSILRDPEDIRYSISYPKELVYRPSLLTQKASLSFPVEKTLGCSPMSSLHFRKYKPLSLGYHREESGFSSEDLSLDQREPSSALLLEWNTETASTRKTDDLPLSHHTKLITYPNAPSSSLTDNPWSSDYSSSHDLVTKELYPLPLLSHYTSGSFLSPPTSRFEHEFERHIIDDEDFVAANQNLQTFHHTNSSDYTYNHNLSNPPVDHFPFEVLGCEIESFRFSSISNSNLLEASSPTQSDHFESHDLIPFSFQSPQPWIDS
ncbi:hypothetical protein EUTSA_v10001946mg [Eutrema salsugineum]|uniref:Uncharacterized protein n=1 Tax=Eutrema salsugineum TaxID=72664 RepID=V4MD18_EUTSA|nr:uncharacterized protein LOC18025546 [Eutrema salsugineum]ESQ50393.1 hypothetical protein EUTSA_v10001946mg [Eutrema salsugineum]